MHTLSVFTGSIAQNTTLGTLPAIVDQAVQTVSNRIQPFQDRQVLAAFGGGTAITQLVIDSPTLNQSGRPNIYPLDSGTPGGLLPAMMVTNNDGPLLPAREQVGLLVSHAGAGTDTLYGALWHSKAPVNKPAGRYKTIKLTTTGSGAAGAWVLHTLALTDALRTGRYKCIGLAVEGTNVLFGRLVFPDQVDRPGTIGNVDATTYMWPFFRNGNMGEFGQFTNDNIPQLELFSTGAMSGTVNVYMDIVWNNPIA